MDMLTHPDHRGWESVTHDEGDHVHTVPYLDLITHLEDGDGDCPCGPTIEPVARKDGSIAWCIHHHSLDGREGDECA